VIKRDEGLNMILQMMQDTLSDLELEYSEAIDREDYKTAFRVFGQIEELRNELDLLLS
jgi:hypothetical protein